MYLSDHLVSDTCRNALYREIPALQDPRFAKIAGHLAFGSWIDGNTGRLLIGAGLLAQAAGKEKSWRQNNFGSGDCIDQFMAPTKIVLNTTLWHGGEGRCRAVRDLSWPGAASQIIETELESGFKMDNVLHSYFASGRKLTPKTRWQERQDVKSAALANMAGEVPLAHHLLEYLNTLPSNRFTWNLSDLRAAARQAWALPVSPKTGGNDPSLHQVRVLRAMYQQGQPFYGQSNNCGTTRIFGQNESILMLRSDIRAVAAPHLIEMDLKNCQLAVIAATWPVPEVSRILATGVSIWDYICGELGITKTPAVKQILKDNCYALPFGRQPHRAAFELNGFFGHGPGQSLDESMDYLPGHGLGHEFVDLPMFQAIVAKSKQLCQEIADLTGAIDCFSRWLSTDNFEPNDILAIQAQAWELELMRPVIDLACAHRDDSHGFQIMLWQHDGFSFVANKTEDTQSWIERLQVAVNNHAERLGIDTTLEQKKRIA